MQRNYLLVIAGCLSIFVALLDFSCIFGGSGWYRFFLGEKMAQMSTACDAYPTIVIFFIASILSVWGLYEFSGTLFLSKLLLLIKCFELITTVYLIRVAADLIFHFHVRSHSESNLNYFLGC